MDTREKIETRTWLVPVLVFTLVAAGIVTGGYLNYRDYEREYRVQVERQLAAIAELKVDELVNWRNDRLADASILYRNAAFSNLASRYLEDPQDMEARGQLETWLGRYQAYHQYDRVFLLDAQGVERVSMPDTPEPVAAHLLVEAPEVMRSGRVAFLDFHRDAPDGPVYLGALVPILDERDDNRPLGVLVLRIDPQAYLYPFIRRWPTVSQTAETLLVRREGNDALFLNELRFQENTALNLRIPLENTQVSAVKAVLGQEGIVEGVDYRGARVIADVRAVPDSPWFLVARMDTAEAYAPLRGRLWQMAVLVGAMLVAAGAGAGLVWWQQRARSYRERYQTEKALREGEERYRRTLDSMLEGCQLIGHDWRYLYINDTAAAHGRRPKEELLGHTMMESYPGIEETQMFAALRHAMDEGTSHRMENEFAYANGSKAWFELSIQPAPEGVFILSIDVTERRRAEEALRESAEKFKRLFEESPAGLALVDTKGVLREANRNLLELVDLGREELIGTTFVDLAARFGLDSQEQLADFRERLTEGTPVNELTFLKRDGKQATITVQSSTIIGDGQAAGVLFIVNDITERKRMQEALEESETKYRELFEDAQIGMYRSKIDGSAFLEVNRKFAEILGFPREQLVGIPGRIRWANPDDRDQMMKLLEDQGGVLVNYEAQMLARNGDVRDVLASIRVRPNAGWLEGSMVDITERKRTERELARSNADLEQFAYVASHDLQEPLRMVASFVALLAERYEGKLDEKADQYIHFAVEGTTRMQSLIQGLLAYSRVGTRARPAEMTDCNVVLGEAVANLRKMIEETGALVTHDELPEVWMDQAQLAQLFQNLIENAIKFHGDAPPVVHLSCERKPGEYLFSVRDNGIGMEAQYFERIFQVFQRLHARDKYPGTGIGLAICKRIVERHGGQIWVKSEPGRGSTFTFTVPIGGDRR